MRLPSAVVVGAVIRHHDFVCGVIVDHCGLRAVSDVSIDAQVEEERKLSCSHRDP